MSNLDGLEPRGRRLKRNSKETCLLIPRGGFFDGRNQNRDPEPSAKPLRHSDKPTNLEMLFLRTGSTTIGDGKSGAPFFQAFPQGVYVIKNSLTRTPKKAQKSIISLDSYPPGVGFPFLGGEKLVLRAAKPGKKWISLLRRESAAPPAPGGLSDNWGIRLSGKLAKKHSKKLIH